MKKSIALEAASELPPPSAILFDWDNTLIDSWATIHLALEETFQSFGLTPWTLEEVRTRVRTSARDSFPQLFGAEAERAIAAYHSAFERLHLEGLKSLEGAEACLEKLVARGIPMGIVSNKSGRFLRREVEALDWGRFFGALVGANDAPRDKPAADPVWMALHQMGVEPTSSVWFVGDTDVDLLCAWNAGCSAVLLRAHAPSANEFPDESSFCHAAGFDELLALVQAVTEAETVAGEAGSR